MPVTEKKYPDWVQKYRIKGTTVKKKGDSYYLYKRTSRRVKGKKYPGCQFSGYEIQAGSPCLHGRRAFGRHHHGTDQYRRIQRPGCSVLT